MFGLILTIILFSALAGATGGDMQDDARGRDTVERLFRDPHRKDD